MPTIPENVYRQVEKRLRGRRTDVLKAEQALYRAQQRAYSAASPPTDKPAVQSSRQGSRVERAALSVLRAEERLETAWAWEEQFRLLDRTFPNDTPEWKAADLIFVQGYDKKSAARILRISRLTLQRRLDAYVCHAALYAAGAGLIRMDERSGRQ